LTTYISQGSVATDLRGCGSFNSSFLRRSFLNLTMNNNMKICSIVTKFCHLALGGPVIMTHCVAWEIRVRAIWDGEKSEDSYNQLDKTPAFLWTDDHSKQYRSPHFIPYADAR